MPPRILVLLSALALAGCVDRTLVVETDPPGALVYLDEEPVLDVDGKPALSPVEIPFVHYGTREIVVRRDGYISEKRMVVISPPAYEVFPIDFFSELLVPYTFEDVHTVDFRLSPIPAPTPAERDALRARGEEFRRKYPTEPTETE
mgnify:CR=1 FL=1